MGHSLKVPIENTVAGQMLKVLPVYTIHWRTAEQSPQVDILNHEL